MVKTRKLRSHKSPFSNFESNIDKFIELLIKNLATITYQKSSKFEIKLEDFLLDKKTRRIFYFVKIS